MVTLRTIAIALLAWQVIKEGTISLKKGEQCMTHATTIMSSQKTVAQKAKEIADSDVCQTAILSAVKAGGTALSTLNADQKSGIFSIIGIMYAYDFAKTKRVNFGSLLDGLTSVFAILSSGAITNGTLKRGRSGRFV